MKRFKSKTIAICIASLITVLGAFGADNYQNSLMSLRIQNEVQGNINLTVYTHKSFSQSIKTEYLGNGVYKFILPHTNSKISSMPDVSGFENVESINIATFPYTPDASGYTQIFLKTKGNPSIRTTTALYLADSQNNIHNYQDTNTIHSQNQETVSTSNNKNNHTQSYSENQNSQKIAYNTPIKAENNVVKEDYNAYNHTNNNDYADAVNTSPKEKIAFTFGTCLIILLVLFIYFTGKEKMSSVVGEQSNFDFDDNDKKHIRKTINKLDKMYRKQSTLKTGSSYKPVPTSMPEATEQSANVDKDDKLEKNIIDIDSLLNQQKQESVNVEIQESIQEEEFDDLAQFLDKDSSEEDIKNIEETNFNEELYTTITSSNSIKFSINDTHKIYQLAQNEISNELLENISDFIPKTNKSKKHDIQKVLEGLLAEYTIKQNIIFTKDDVNALTKLMSVELDPDFVTDLHTDPIRTENMRKAMQEKEAQAHKTSKMLTLNVKDFLPDLSKELLKQGNKRIESNAQPQVVYYSKGYDFMELSVSDELPDITKAMQVKDANKYRPSDSVPFALEGYKNPTIKVAENLPDLEDVKAHPEKYEEKKKPKAIVDENALLKSLEKASLRPVYDTDDVNYNIEDNISDLKVNKNLHHIEKIQNTNVNIVSNLKENIINNELNRQPLAPKIKTIDTNSLIKDKNEKKEEKNITEHHDITQEQAVNTIEIKKDESSLKMPLNSDKNQYEEPKVIIKEKEIKQQTDIKEDTRQNNKHGGVIKTVKCNNIVCSLLKNETGYNIIGKTENNVVNLKHYDSLKSENIQVRINESKPDGKMQYLVKVGFHKFIINVLNGSMEFVMDLC